MLLPEHTLVAVAVVELLVPLKVKQVLAGQAEAATPLTEMTQRLLSVVSPTQAAVVVEQDQQVI